MQRTESEPVPKQRTESEPVPKRPRCHRYAATFLVRRWPRPCPAVRSRGYSGCHRKRGYSLSFTDRGLALRATTTAIRI